MFIKLLLSQKGTKKAVKFLLNFTSQYDWINYKEISGFICIIKEKSGKNSTDLFSTKKL